MAKVKVRVVTAQYGEWFRGEVLDVEEAELHRVSSIDEKTGARLYEALIPVEEETRRKAEAERPAPEVDVDAQQRKAAAKGWAQLDRRSREVMESKRVQEAKRVAELANSATKSK
jgi:hypothetical protein